MAEHNDLGKEGEAEAIKYLVDNGYKIRTTNWRFGKSEIDIIAENDQYIAIVEVKTRSSDSHGTPQEFVTRRKQKQLIRAAHAYAIEEEINKDVYFDIIAITLHPYFLEHIHQAFYP